MREAASYLVSSSNGGGKLCHWSCEPFTTHRILYSKAVLSLPLRVASFLSTTAILDGEDLPIRVSEALQCIARDARRTVRGSLEVVNVKEVVLWEPMP
jgi:hypothetical protein